MKNSEEALVIRYDSDEENKSNKLKSIALKAENLKTKKYFDHDKILKEKQIIFCTRTHS